MSEPKEFNFYTTEKKLCMLVFLEEGSHKIREVRISKRHRTRECYSYSGLLREQHCWVVDNCGNAYHCIKLKDHYYITALGVEETNLLLNLIAEDCSNLPIPLLKKKVKKSSSHTSKAVDLWSDLPKG